MNKKIIILNKNKEVATVRKNLLCLSQDIVDTITMKSSIVNKRYFSPVITENTNIFELGASFVGLKHILVQLGFNAFEVDDVIAMCDKSNVIFIKKENNKNSTYINADCLDVVINNILDLLDKDREIVTDEIVIGMVYQLCKSKIRYIQDRIDKKVDELDKQLKCKRIINKYNLHNNKFYGNQQWNITREICNSLDVNLSFSKCLEEFGINCNWIGRAPYNVTYGKEWGVCEIILN